MWPTWHSGSEIVMAGMEAAKHSGKLLTQQGILKGEEQACVWLPV